MPRAIRLRRAARSPGLRALASRLGATPLGRVARRVRAVLPQGASPLRPGLPAPPWSVPAVPDGHLSLADVAGERVVLFFFPRADTPGCTRQACGLRDAQVQGARIVGASCDHTDSLEAFRGKYGLPFSLLSDPDGVLAARYGVGRPGRIRRTTFVIGPEGTIERVLERVDPVRHADQVAQVLRELGR